MREMSVAEQRYQAVLAVVSDGATVTEVAARFSVSRQTVHDWLANYEAGGLENLGDRSHRPGACPPHEDAVIGISERIAARPDVWPGGAPTASTTRTLVGPTCRTVSTVIVA